MALKIGDKVAPTVSTKDNLTYGYVREMLGDERVRVYWPEIKSAGDWPVYALKAKRRVKP